MEAKRARELREPREPRDTREALEATDQLVLLALARLQNGSGGYGVSIRREVATVADRELALATVYAVLDRLERRGLVRSWLTDPLPERGGRARKCFALTPPGTRQLLEARAAFDRLWEGLDLAPARR